MTDFFLLVGQKNNLAVARDWSLATDQAGKCTTTMPVWLRVNTNENKIGARLNSDFPGEDGDLDKNWPPYLTTTMATQHNIFHIAM